MANNNQEVQKVYTVYLDDNGMLTSILVEEEGGIGRWMYKREAKSMELHLTDAIFEKTVEACFNNGFCEADDLYQALKVNDEYYANLMKKVYKQYIRNHVLETSLHRDAFWG